ncbi:hypothetical protein [Actinomadura hibisca]|uniref:hypothetical protein n=1 Tax=Actinomadura hibisca TaxID=68565 RepID=UPI000829DF0F|nr:hypothetical protein [Actinomadura hibisca]
MKSTRPARGTRSAGARVAGYGGAALLVAVALAVLLMPLFDQDGGTGTAAGRTPGGTASQPAGQQGLPGAGRTVTPTNPLPQQNRGGQVYPDGRPSPQPSGQNRGQNNNDGGPPLPGTGGGVGLTWCPAGTSVYRPSPTGRLEVSVSVSGSGAVRAEVQLRGGAPKSQQATVKGGRPHTFTFPGVAPAQIRYVKITTMSVGISTDTCYARPGA